MNILNISNKLFEVALQDSNKKVIIFKLDYLLQSAVTVKRECLKKSVETKVLMR